VEQDKSKKRGEPVYSLRLRAGKRRTYFFDVRPTRSEDFYLTITESKKRFDDDGYERHKLFLYKEDFNKFMKALELAMNHVKEELMPDYDFDEFTREIDEESIQKHGMAAPAEDMTQAEEPEAAKEESGEEETDESEDFEVKFETGEETAGTEEEKTDEAPSGDEDESKSTDSEEAEKW